MVMKRILAAIILCLLALPAAECDSPFVNPKTGPDTPYKCASVRQHLCSDNKGCCWNDSVCVPDGCEYSGNSMVGASRDGGSDADHVTPRLPAQ